MLLHQAAQIMQRARAKTPVLPTRPSSVITRRKRAVSEPPLANSSGYYDDDDDVFVHHPNWQKLEQVLDYSRSLDKVCHFYLFLSLYLYLFISFIISLSLFICLFVLIGRYFKKKGESSIWSGCRDSERYTKIKNRARINGGKKIIHYKSQKSFSKSTYCIRT